MDGETCSLKVWTSDTIFYTPQYFAKNNVVIQILWLHYCLNVNILSELSYQDIVNEFVRSSDTMCRVFGKIKKF